MAVLRRGPKQWRFSIGGPDGMASGFLQRARPEDDVSQAQAEFEEVWASSGLTDIHHQGQSPRKDVQNGDHGEEEAASTSLVHAGVQG